MIGLMCRLGTELEFEEHDGPTLGELREANPWGPECVHPPKLLAQCARDFECWYAYVREDG